MGWRRPRGPDRKRSDGRAKGAEMGRIKRNEMMKMMKKKKKLTGMNVKMMKKKKKLRVDQKMGVYWRR